MQELTCRRFLRFLVGRVYQTLGQFNEAINEYVRCLTHFIEMH